MNIFILDDNVQKCVEYHVDRHITKMTTETAQLLSYVYHLVEGDKTPNFLHNLQKRHITHPCTIWAGESLKNYLWLCDFGIALYNEYQFRYKQPFKHWRAKFIFEWCKKNPPRLPNIEKTEFARAINKEENPDLLDKSIFPNIVDCYREYYRRDKTHLFFRKDRRTGKKIYCWKNRKIPYWLLDKC